MYIACWIFRKIRHLLGTCSHWTGNKEGSLWCHAFYDTWPWLTRSPLPMMKSDFYYICTYHINVDDELGLPRVTVWCYWLRKNMKTMPTKVNANYIPWRNELFKINTFVIFNNFAKIKIVEDISKQSLLDFLKDSVSLLKSYNWLP